VQGRQADGGEGVRIGASVEEEGSHSVREARTNCDVKRRLSAALDDTANLHNSRNP
jgi:hypothetical protein